MWHRVKRHIMWFPFLLVAVTVILAVTIVLVDRNRTEVYEEVADVLEVIERVDPAVTDEDYQVEIAVVLAPVWDVVDAGEGSVETVRGVRDALVAMRVSSDARDVHIRLVAATNQLIAGVEGDALALADAQVRFAELREANVWLQ